MEFEALRSMISSKRDAGIAVFTMNLMTTKREKLTSDYR